jgi:hypothetical protein
MTIWAGHVAQTEEMRNAYKSLAENLKGREFFRDLGVGGRTILKR